MPNWKKVIVSGSNAILSNITASGDISASGDIYATNFYGNFEGTIDSASYAETIEITPTAAASNFPIVFTLEDNQLYTDLPTGDFYYRPSTNTLTVENIVGTASLATNAINSQTASLAEKVKLEDFISGGPLDLVVGNTSNTLYTVPDNNLTYNFDTDTLTVPNLEGTASVAITASYAANTLTVNGNVNNRILTATGNNTINGESSLTFNGITLSLDGNFIINPQGYQEFFYISSTPGGAYGIIGDTNENGNSTIFKVDDENSNITLSFTDSPIIHTFDSTGLDLEGNLTSSGNIKAAGDISASGDVYADNVRTDTIIFPNTNGKIITPNGQINDDYITIDGTNRYFEVRFDADPLFKLDFNNELISLRESTKHGINASDTHQFTGSVDIKGNTNVDGNLTINGDITAEQYIINSTVTNVTMSFSSGSTIFGDSLDDTHLFTGSVDITGSLTVDGITYPTTDGDNGDVLITDGNGNLSFTRTTVYANVKNVSGVDLVKGYPVHVTGTSGNASEIIVASASNAATMPAHFILNEDIDNGAEGQAIAIGFINGVNTVGFGEGDTVYVGADGGYTNVKPTGSNLIQNLGIVTKVHSNGSGYVLGAGRSNDVPNIPSGYAWVGNSDSVATAVPTSSFAGEGDNLGNHIATQDLDMAGFSISASLNITASGNISASGDIIGNSLYSDEYISIKGTEYPTSSFYTIETEPGQNYKEGVIHFSGSIDDVSSTVFDLFAISTGSNQILQLDYQVSWYKSNVLWASVGHKSKLIVGPLMTSAGLNNYNPTAADFNVFTTTGNTNPIYTNVVYEFDGGSSNTIWSSSFQNEYLQYSINYANSSYSDNIHENGDEVKININYKLIKSI